MKGKFFVFSLENCDNGTGCQLVKLSHQLEGFETEQEAYDWLVVNNYRLNQFTILKIFEL